MRRLDPGIHLEKQMAGGVPAILLSAFQFRAWI
jgi:hypothetical protein